MDAAHLPAVPAGAAQPFIRFQLGKNMEKQKLYFPFDPIPMARKTQAECDACLQIWLVRYNVLSRLPEFEGMPSQYRPLSLRKIEDLQPGLKRATIQRYYAANQLQIHAAVGVVMQENPFWGILEDFEEIVAEATARLNKPEASSIRFLPAGRPPIFTAKQEEDLATYAQYKAEHGTPLTYQEFIEAAVGSYNYWKLDSDILELSEEYKETHPETGHFVNYEARHKQLVFKLSRHWFTGFNQRRKDRGLPPLVYRHGEELENSRIAGFTQEKMDIFWRNAKKVYRQQFGENYNDPKWAKYIFNIDEAGVQGEKDTNKLQFLVMRGTPNVHTRSSGNRAHVTVTGIVSADGTAHPPVFIYDGPGCSEGFAARHPIFHRGAGATRTESGYQSDVTFELGMDLLLERLDESYDNKAVFIVDSHYSHFSVELLMKLRARGMHLLTLPPHTTHRTQPLDVGAFSAFKTSLSEYVSELNVHPELVTDYDGWDMSTHPMDKLTYCLGNAYLRISPQTVINSFRKTGVFPLNPTIFDADYKLFDDKLLAKIQGGYTIITEAEAKGYAFQRPQSVDADVPPAYIMHIKLENLERHSIECLMQNKFLVKVASAAAASSSAADPSAPPSAAAGSSSSMVPEGFDPILAQATGESILSMKKKEMTSMIWTSEAGLAILQSRVQEKQQKEEADKQKIEQLNSGALKIIKIHILRPDNSISSPSITFEYRSTFNKSVFDQKVAAAVDLHRNQVGASVDPKKMVLCRKAKQKKSDAKCVQIKGKAEIEKLVDGDCICFRDFEHFDEGVIHTHDLIPARDVTIIPAQVPAATAAAGIDEQMAVIVMPVEENAAAAPAAMVVDAAIQPLEEGNAVAAPAAIVGDDMDTPEEESAEVAPAAIVDDEIEELDSPVTPVAKRSRGR